MTDFVYDGTPLPNGKVDRFPSPGPTDQYVVAAEWNTSMQAMLDLRTAILNGQYHGMQAAYWKNASGVTQMRTWWDSSNSRLVLAGNAAGTAQYAHINASGDLTLSGSIFASNVGGTNTGDVTIGTANGLSLLGQTLSMDLAGPTTIGTVGVGSQVFAGDKTFTSTTSMTTANTLLSITPPSTVSGVSYTDPSVQIDYTNAGTAQFMLQLGGKTGTTWEMALGVYTGRFPIISSRANDIFVSMASGKSLSPLSGNNDLGISSNLWRRLYVQDGVLNANGTSSSHVGVKVGLSTADASVVSGAKLVSFRTGVGGSEVEYGYWAKGKGLVISKPPVLNEPAFYLPEPVSAGSYGLAGALVWTNSNSYMRLSTTSLDLNSYAVPLVLSAAFSTAELRGGIGGTSGDIVAKVGTTVADASVNVAAKLLSIRTGMGGTEVEKAYFRKSGSMLIVDAGGSGNPLAFGNAVDLYNVAGGVKYDAGSGTVGFYNTNNAAYLSLSFADGNVRATGGHYIGGAYRWGSNTTGGLFNESPTQSRLDSQTGASMAIVSPLGAGVSDVGVKIGTTVADASVNAAAKLMSIRTGIGATEVEKAYFAKDGGLWNTNGRLGSFSSPNVYVWCDSGAARLVYSSTVLEVVAGTMQLFDGSAYSFKVTSGRIDQSGTNSSGTPGAATINKPTGVSAIANGASSVTITNSLVTASSRVMITWHNDHGAARTWVARAAGSFTVNISSNATADAAFSWEVSSLL